MEEKFYFCEFCRDRINSLEEVLLVEDQDPRGFCSEDCIRKFYQCYIDLFEGLEKKGRQQLALEREACQQALALESEFQATINHPDEVIKLRNELGDELFFYHKELSWDKEPFHMVVGCLVFEESPSFIFFQMATQSETLLRQLLPAPQEESSEASPGSTEDEFNSEYPGVKRDKIEMDEKTSQAVELKRSSFLAELMEERSELDIPFEEFSHFEKYLPLTLQDPDEIYRSEDQEGDDILIYIKSFEEQETSFYYIVVSFHLDSRQETQEEVLVPLLSFPSIDRDLYQHYKKGERISGGLYN